MTKAPLSAQDNALIKKIAWRVMPLVAAIYLVAIIDKANVGFAKLQMASALHMSEVAYGFGSSLFFVAYLMFEIPSTLAARRYGPHIWLARIMLTWGMGTIALGLVQSSGMFYALRFFLGAAEAGAYPILIYYISTWFPQSHRLQMVGILTLGSSVGNILGALLGGPLLDLDGLLGIAGWRWVFIVTGIPALVMAGVVVRLLPRSPEGNRFLSLEEQARLAALLQSEAPEQAHGNPMAIIWSADVLRFSALYTMLLTSLYGVIYWSPSVIRAFGVTGTENGLLSSVPWIVAVAALLLVPRRLRRHDAVLKAMPGIALLGVLSFAGCVLLDSSWMRLLALTIGTPCVAVLVPCFWALPYHAFSGARSALAIGTISTIGTLGGFIAQNLMPLAADITHVPAGAMLVPALCLFGAGITAIIFRATGH
jgi:MFS family permease